MPFAPVPSGELWCLGVGDGRPSPDRRRSSYLYALGGRGILIDCGEGCCRAFRAQGFTSAQVDHVVLSHMHSDHVGSFSLFMQDLWLEPRRAPLSISAPTEALPRLQEWLCQTLLFPALMPFRMRWTPLRAGVAQKSGAVRLTPYPTRHLQSLAKHFQASHPEVCFEAFSLVLEAGGKRVAHSADIGHEDDLDPLLAKPLDLLVCELAHVEPEKVFVKLRGRSIGRVVFIHLANEYWTHRAALRRHARKCLGDIPFQFAADDDRIGF